jgi:hypothetical protein
MKSIAIMILILGLMFAGCANKQKEQAQSNQQMQNSTNTVNQTAQIKNNKKIEPAAMQRRKRMRAVYTLDRQRAEASLENKIKEGKAIVITDEGQNIPLKMVGSTVTAMAMPDGKLYPVEIEGGRTMVTIPGKGKMEKKMINGTMYLVDSDNNMYRVQVINKKLVAVLNNGTEQKLAKR